MRKILTFILLLIFSTAFSATGWFQDYIKLNVNGAGTSAPTGWYWIGSDPGYATQLNSANLGNVHSLVIDGCDMKYWSDNQDRTGGAFYYKIMSEDGNNEIIAPVETLWDQSFLGGNNYQGLKSTTIDLTSELTNGTTYKLHFWAKSWGTNQGDNWLNNNDNNYVATFTYRYTTFSGTANWTETARWDYGVPTIFSVGIIDGAVTIDSEISIKNLTINSEKSLTINAGKSLTISGNLNNSGTFTINSDGTGTGSLITNGTVSGNVKVQRYLDEVSESDTWHYVSSPVSGQAINNDWLTNNSILSSNQLFRYDEDQNYWIIYGSTGDPEAFGDASFVAARGYSVARDGAGVISFNGTVRTDDVTYAATYTADKGKGWNLVGNPFTSAIGVTNSASSTGKFLSDNSGVIDANYLALYIWDEQATYENYRNDYKVISNSDIDGYTEITQNYIQPGQAFMVKVASAGNLAFNKNMQYHADVNFYKSKETWPSVELVVEGNGVSNSTSVGFHEDMTAGLDPSYDVGKLKGNPDIALYTRLVEDNGVDFAIQALPFENIETVEIPVGISVSNRVYMNFLLPQQILRITTLFWKTGKQTFIPT